MAGAGRATHKMFRLVTLPRPARLASCIAKPKIKDAAMSVHKSREIRLARRPEGLPGPADFQLAETEVPGPGEGQVLIRNIYMSVDPYMRGRMVDRASYVPPFQVGEAL